MIYFFVNKNDNQQLTQIFTQQTVVILPLNKLRSFRTKVFRVYELFAINELSRSTIDGRLYNVTKMTVK